MFRNHLSIALRNISKHKLYSLIKIAGLSIGICACIVIFLVTRFEFSYDRFHPDIDRIYHIGTRMPNWDFISSRTPGAMPAAIAKEIPGVEHVARFYNYSADISIRHKDGKTMHFSSEIPGTEASDLIVTDPGYFAIFQYRWLAGNPGSSLGYPNSVVLSEKKAHALFGNLPIDEILGRQIIYNDSLTVQVSGIVKDWRQNTDFPFTEFISFGTIDASWLHNRMQPAEWQGRRGTADIWTLVRLAKGVSADKTAAACTALMARHIPDNGFGKWQAFLQPLAQYHFDTRYSHDDNRKAYLPALYSMIGVAVLILVIAVINFINLSVAQSSQRTKEIGIRKVLGSGRKNLIYQFLTETFLLTLFTTFLAVLLVRPALWVFHDYIPYGVTFSIFDPPTILFLLTMMLAATIAAGFYPAMVLSSWRPVISLKGSTAPRGSGKSWLRKGFIIFQFTISLVFIMGAILINRQIHFMMHTDFGFRSDAILALRAPERDFNPKVLQEKIQHIPGVAGVISESNPPMGWMHHGLPLTYKEGDGQPFPVSADYGSEAFIPFYQIKMLAGRNLVHSDSLTEFVVNETLAKKIGAKTPADAIGKFLYFKEMNGVENGYPIVGVVADYHEQSFHEPIGPVVIGHMPAVENDLAIKLETRGKDAASAKQTISRIEEVWKTLYPGKEMDYAFIDDTVKSFYDQEIRTAALMNIIMIVSIFISCMGLYGLSLFAAERRTKEISIRKILGATISDVLVLLNKEFVMLILIALVISSPLALYFMRQWLQDYAFRVPVGPAIFFLAGAAAVVIALITVSFQALRVALANPAKSLRSE